MAAFGLEGRCWYPAGRSPGRGADAGRRWRNSRGPRRSCARRARGRTRTHDRESRCSRSRCPVAKPECPTLTARTLAPRANARRRGGPRGKLFARVAAGFRVACAPARGLGVEAEIARAQVVDGLQEERGAGDQQQRERDLRDDEYRRKPEPRAPAGRLLQAGVHVLARRRQRGRQTEQDHRAERHERDEGEMRASGVTSMSIGWPWAPAITSSTRLPHQTATGPGFRRTPRAAGSPSRAGA